MKIDHIIRLILLGFSLLGYIRFAGKWIRPEFSVGFIFSAIPACLFFSGILNLMPEAAVLIFIGGLVCFVLCLKDHSSLKNLFNPGFIFLIAGGFGLAVLLYGSRFVDQDNFDHWATVVQVLIRKQRLPNYLDTYLPHKTYPTGAACWIYFWMFITGIRSEYFQMFSQSFLILAMTISFFPLAKNLFAELIAAVVCVMLICGNQALTSLQVDNILSMAALSAICFSVYYKNDLKNNYKWLSAWLIFIPAVKNSGILFDIFVLLMVMPRIRIRRTAALASAAGLTVLLWQKHADLVFTDASKSKHAMSLINYRTVLGEKTKEDIFLISRKVLDREFSLNNHFIYLLILAVLLVIIFTLVRSKKSLSACKLCVYSVLCYCIHEAGLLAVYLVSMPLREAIILSHFNRYQRTAVVFSAGVLLLAVLNLLEEKRISLPIRWIAGVICCLILSAGIHPYSQYLHRQNSSALKTRSYYDQLIANSHIPEGSRILVFTDDGEDVHNIFDAYTRYYFAPSRVNHKTPESNPSMDNYDYIFVLTDSKKAKAYVTENAPSENLIVLMR